MVAKIAEQMSRKNAGGKNIESETHNHQAIQYNNTTSMIRDMNMCVCVAGFVCKVIRRETVTQLPSALDPLYGGTAHGRLRYRTGCEHAQRA